MNWQLLFGLSLFINLILYVLWVVQINTSRDLRNWAAEWQEKAGEGPKPI